jgi:hypothetical protein
MRRLGDACPRRNSGAVIRASGQGKLLTAKLVAPSFARNVKVGQPR